MIHKLVDNEIELIKSLSNLKNVEIEDNNKIGLAYTHGVLSKHSIRGFILDIESNYHISLDDFSTNRLVSYNDTIRLNLLAHHISRDVTISENVIIKNKFSIINFHEEKFSNSANYYCRNVIPIKRYPNQSALGFNNIIDGTKYKYGNGIITNGLLKVEISNMIFEIFIIDKYEEQFLFIDCLHHLTPDLFGEFAWSILIGIGYLIGTIPQDDVYSFYYENEHLESYITYQYKEARPTLKTIYHPINANPHSWINDFDEAQRFWQTIPTISFTQLSILCQLIHDEEDIKVVLLLMMESLTRTHLLMPAGLSIVLESLTEFLSDKATVKPISNEIVAVEFRNELILILEKYKDNNDFKKGYDVIKSKINQINTPTNSEKLKAPFSHFGINLTKIDEDAIKYRNAFLHGNVLLKKPKGEKQYQMDSSEISLRLVTLINCIVMKMIGYNGAVLNHVKIQSQYTAKEIAEDYYR